MSVDSGDRTKVFPAIEKKHGQPIKYFIDQLNQLKNAKYPEQIAYLRENHNFSQAHANAVVMYVRGSKSSKRHQSPSAYFQTLDPQARKTAKAIFKIIQDKYPNLDLVIAWNHPMLRSEKDYIFGLSSTKSYLLINPFSKDVLDKHIPRLKNYKVNKHTIQIPFDWKINQSLLVSLVKSRISELKQK